MIPKTIHFCWLSKDAYPENILRCIESWKVKLPDYEFMLWNLDKSEISSSFWVQEAFAHKKYAFAADYIRLYALYHYGGIYLDSDVEVLKSFNDLLDLPYFIGLDSCGYIEAAVLACEPGNPWIGKCLNYYKDRHFVLNDNTLDTKPLPRIMKSIITQDYKITPLDKSLFPYKLDEHLYIHSYAYFSPKRHDTGVINVKDNTYTIHHYAMSWLPNKVRLFVTIKRTLMLMFGSNCIDFLIRLFSLREIKTRMLSQK